MDDKFRSRKFRLATFFSVTDFILTAAVCIAQPLSISAALTFYAGAQGLILGLYGAANVMDKKVQE